MITGKADRWFQAANTLFMILVGLCCVFPMMYVISVSLTPLDEVMKHGGFVVIPRQITFTAYKEVFVHSPIPRAFLNTLFVTFAGTALSLAFTVLMAFGLAKAGVPGRSVYLFLVVFTILFNGGIIPTFLVVRQFGLLNSLWSLIIPTLIAGFNLLIVKTFFEQLPTELEDAAVIDGAGEWLYLLRVVLPLSLPVLATVGLFYAVNYWNVYFHGILYLTNPKLYPLQVALRQLIAVPDSSMIDPDTPLPPETMKMAAVVVSTLPIVIVYPFLQKYFVKGATIGAVKG